MSEIPHPTSLSSHCQSSSSLSPQQRCNSVSPWVDAPLLPHGRRPEEPGREGDSELQPGHKASYLRLILQVKPVGSARQEVVISHSRLLRALSVTDTQTHTRTSLNIMSQGNELCLFPFFFLAVSSNSNLMCFTVSHP